jgi:hypothetical protein
MPTRKFIKSALAGFLGTYTSRYTDYLGYWLFGFLVSHLDRIEIDLLDSSVAIPVTPLSFAAEFAHIKFIDQIRKWGFDLSVIRKAILTIERLAHKDGLVNGNFAEGFEIKFSVSAVSDIGNVYKSELVVFVAPHNPAFEIRSGLFPNEISC